MDEKDEAIIRILERRGNLASRVLAESIGLPVSTVYRRVKRLEQQGVITGYKAIINYEKTNIPIGAYILINLEEITPGKGRIPKADIINRIKKIIGVQDISDVEAADFDLLLKARFKTLKELSHFTEELRSVEGIEDFKTAIITESITT